MKNILFAFLLGLISIVPLAAQQKVNGGMAIAGPDPWQDLQAYGSIRCGYDGICETTGNTILGSTTVTLTGVINNQGYIRYPNGAGIAIPGAGPNNIQTTPAAPTVTPEMVTGSTTYQYACVGIDANEGLTAASSVTVISNGDANLGNVGKVANVFSISRDATGLITVTTVSPHGFVYNDPSTTSPRAGTIVNISGVVDGSFNGQFVVQSSSGSTFTVMTGMRSAATSSGGIATVFGFNMVTCPALSGTTVQYLVFGRTSGSMLKVGRTQRDDNVLYDYGAIYNHETYPNWYPVTPPLTAKKGILSTTVVSGGKTSSIVIANAANATLTGTEIQYDDGPAIRKAIAASCAFAGCSQYWTNTIFFSPLGHGVEIAQDYYVINSPVTIPTGMNLLLDNGVLVNEPITLTSNNTVRGIANGPGPQFAMQGYTQLLGAAHPQILQHSGSATVIDGISFNSMDIGGLGFTGQFTLSHSAIVSDDSASRIPLVLGGPNTVDMLQLSDITFYSTEQQIPYNPEPPLISSVWLRCSFAGLTVKGNGNNLTGRGILFDGRQNSNCPSGIGIAGVVFDMGYGVSEVPTTPLISVYGHMQGEFHAVLKNIANTDAAAPYVAIWTVIGTHMYLENLRAMPSCGTLSSYKTGYWADSISIVNSTAADAACIGQDTGVSMQAVSNWVDLGDISGNVPSRIGQLNESQPIVLSGPVSPPVMWTYKPTNLTCTVAAGGAVSIDSIHYYLYVIGYNGGESARPLNVGSCLVTTTTGNQTVNLSWGAVPGAQAYLIHKFTNAGISGHVGACHSITTTSCSDVFSAGDGTSQVGAILDGTGLPLIDSTQIVTGKIVLPYMNGSVAGINTAITIAADGSLQCTVNGGSTSACLPGTIVRSFGTTFGDTAESALTAGSIVYMTIPYACTINAWNMTADAGTATIDIWKIASGTVVPTIANTITASALPALSTGTAIHSTVLTGWITSIITNDIVAFQLKTVNTAKYVEIDLQCTQ